MKIFYTAYHNPNFDTITEYIERALVRAGHEVYNYDDHSLLLPGRIRFRFPFLDKIDLAFMNYRLFQKVKHIQPDLFLAAGGHRILPSTVRAVRKYGIHPVLWTVDPPHEFRLLRDAVSEYDIILCGGSESVEILKNEGHSNLHFLPFAFDRMSHHPVELSDSERTHWGADVVFVGSIYENREKLFSQLTNFNFAIWGPGWERLPERHPLRKHHRGGNTKPEDWIKILSASKIAVIAHFQDGKTPCYQASPKVYETLACKTFALVDDQPDVFRLFHDGEHLVKFTSAHDLKDKVAWFLAHPEQRKTIAEAGRREVLSKHAYDHRIREMMEIVTKEIYYR